MAKDAPSRQRLLKLEADRAAVGKGLTLLMSRREALMREFFGALAPSIEARERLSAMLSLAARKAVVARALAGDERADSFSIAAKREVSLNITIRNVWGVTVPEIEETRFRRGARGMGPSPVGERAGLLDAASEFEGAMELIVRIASAEARLGGMGEAIKTDTRRINAITELLMPSLSGRIKAVTAALDEREREEVFRLKRYKNLKSGR